MNCNITWLRVAKNQWQSSTNGSTFFIRHGHYCSPQTTCPRVLLRYQESTRLSPSTKTNILNVPPVKSQDNIRSYSYNIKTSRSIKYGDRCEDLNESPLQLLQAQKAQARPAESSMRILSFGPRVLLNLLIPLILSLAKILPLRIPGSSTSIWGMSGSITLYADVPGFSIKLSANSNQSSPWGQRLILLKGTMKAIHLQSGCEFFQTERKYIRALSTIKFDGPGYEPTSYSKLNEDLDTTVQITKSYEEKNVISYLQT
ncbi:hypothetical protein HID58_074679 [Brassica napus]|uniref:Uncharacterized protein n=1 Tax=Brassica napus TaxID=3708 RepID=A0ABQ7YJ63_BRANA|nr:hypothetical protein HID58_074679 [Brassica napus]